MGVQIFEIDFIMHRTEREKLETNLAPGVSVHYYLQGNHETVSGFLKAKSWAKLANAIHLLGYLKMNIVFTERN